LLSECYHGRTTSKCAVMPAAWWWRAFPS